MDQILTDWLRYVAFYIGFLTWPWAVSAAIAGTAIPVLQGALSPRGRTSIGGSLRAYIAMVFLGLFSLFLLGIALQEFAPKTFEVWRDDLNGGANNSLPSSLFRFVASMPVAMGFTTLASGVLARPRRLLTALLGVFVAISLAAIVILGGILVGCAGWSSCP